MPDLDKLHNHVKRLDALLEDQQPGYASWVAMVGEHWRAIFEMWDGTDGTIEEEELTGMRMEELRQ